MNPCYRLIITCPDQVGIVAEVSSLIAAVNGWIEEANHHSDHESGWFFMRYEIRESSIATTLDSFKQQLQTLADKYSLQWELSHSVVKQKVCLLVSQHNHCLHEVLHRWQEQELDFDLQAIISNHKTAEPIARWFQVPFHYIKADPKHREQHFEQVLALFDHYQPELIGLARYMQILPANICERYPLRIINIHHGFLPSFMGAKPYHQAAATGVKLIGATCHYVTEALDSGPIIEQDVIRINHSHQVEDLIQLGKEVEKRVFTKGLKLHLEKRILVHDNKTVVFD